MSPDNRQNRGGYRQDNRNQPDPIIQEMDPKWITDAIDEKAIKFTEKLGKKLAKIKLSSSQIRNVYGEMKRIQLKGFNNEKTAFLLLKPKLAYAKSRDKNAMGTFEPILQNALNAVKTEAHYQNLMDFMEAILAYHKSYGGK